MPNIPQPQLEEKVLMCLKNIIEDKQVGNIKSSEIYAHIYNLELNQINNLLKALNL